jgi:phage gp29-like protein
MANNSAPGGAHNGSGLLDAFGRGAPVTDDPAWQPPGAPLANVAATRERVLVIHREIPNSIVQSGWAVSDVRNALIDLVIGQFDQPAQLHDTIAGDSRIQSAMRSRSGGLLGRAIRFKIPQRFKDDKRARKCMRAWENHWPQMNAEPALLDILEGSASLGFSYAQTLWDTNKPIWKPYLLSFNARYSYYHWTLRHHIAVTMDGQVPITPGDGHWVLHAPNGQYRGWMRASIRAVAQWWLARNYALRDWAAYCEKHGFPMLLVDTPFGADPNDISQIQTTLTGIGQNSVLQLPGSVDVNKYGKYDLRYLEPADENWQAFKALIEACNDEITLALLGQNLTSQVKEGSFAAARVHADVRQAILEADARALARTLYTQVLRPFAAVNFGDADLAPSIEWDVRPPEDLETKAKTFAAFGQGVAFLRQAGVSIDNIEQFARRFGLPGLKTHQVDPLQVEAKLATATGTTSEDDAPDDEDESKDDDDQARPGARATQRRSGLAKWRRTARERAAARRPQR